MNGEIKKNFRRNKSLYVMGFLLLASNILIFCLWYYFDCFSGLVTVSKGLSKDLLTIDAVFAGFAYTTLGTMVSFSGNSEVIRIDKDGYIDKYYNGVYLTIGLFLIAMFLGFLTGFSIEGVKHHTLFMIQILANFDSFVYFMISVIGFRRLINWIRLQKNDA